MVRRSVAGSVVFGVLAVSQGVSASVEPSGVATKLDHWNLTPVVDRFSGSAEVVGILAICDPAEVTGENISVVWYTRSVNDPDAWHAHAWIGVQEWDAIEYVKSVWEIPDELDSEWATFTEKLSPQAADAPEPYRLGFLADDPLLEAIEESPDRDQLVLELAGLGYRVADVPIDFQSNLNTDETRTDLVLGAIAYGIEEQENSLTPSEDAFSPAFEQKFQESFGSGWFCYPLTFEVPQPWGDWGAASGWLFDGNSIGPGGAAVCLYKKKMKRTRQIVEYTVTLSCSVGVSNVRTDSLCYWWRQHCPNGGGACPATPACPVQEPGPNEPPPPGTQIFRQGC